MADLVFGAKRLNSQHFEMKRKASFSKLHGVSLRALPNEHIESTYTEKMWSIMSRHLPTDIETIQRMVVNHVEYTLSRNRFNMNEEACYRATAYSVRDRLIELFNDTNASFYSHDVKRCYYMSLEFLTGRALQNALTNMDVENQYADALTSLGYKLESLYEYEHDAGLGNGGLGRLAACFLDSMATCNFPCWGYGIRYTYGIFEQKIVNGWQCEYPDYWLNSDNPWEICRQDVTYAVRFGGEVVSYKNENGVTCKKWKGGQIVQAIAYDNPIPGFDTFNCINLRLWRAAPSKEFDFESFNQGNYLEAVAERQDAEYISAVLYPNDSTDGGKELRLKQQYFFCCATIQDVLRRFKKKADRDWMELPEKIAIQLNDTHPTIGIPELMRILIDVEYLEWDVAFDLTRRVFHYTNHTVLPEALEKWPAALIGKLLPRHLEIINEINFRFISEVRSTWGDDHSKISRMSIYEEGWTKLIRMANLAVIGSNRVNGVAAIHSNLVKRDLFPLFVEWYKQKGESNKFVNMTNGVTPRRWIHNCNRLLSQLISEWLGSDDWLKNLDMMAGLLNHLDNKDLLAQWAQVKRKNKERLCKWVKYYGGPELSPDMLFDIQTKRIHEYKRQHLNALYMIHRYLVIKRMSAAEREKVVPRATMVGGKAAPGYTAAKTIIKMINCIAEIVNNDPEVSPYFKVFFLPNYNVSSASIIIPASDINQQISTAGTEASGTSNMKYVMNGSLIIGTMDGANVEIIEEGGDDTAFVFGAREPEVARIRENARNGKYPIDPRLNDVFSFIRCGHLAQGDKEADSQFCGMLDRLLNNGDGHNGDFYLVCHDFEDYVRANEKADALYVDTNAWNRLSIKAAASMGKFSTDRTIQEYAEQIWHILPHEILRPSTQDIEKRHFHAEELALGADDKAAPSLGSPEKSTERVSEQIETENACLQEVTPDNRSFVSSDDGHLDQIDSGLTNDTMNDDDCASSKKDTLCKKETMIKGMNLTASPIESAESECDAVPEYHSDCEESVEN